MSTLETLWWLFFWTALGLCVGSFLNAVIYRLPRNRSLLNPFWSACPDCGHRIRWYDNLPVISFILLRGRCRDCDLPISTGYMVIELSMALVVLMLLDAFFIGQVRAGLSDSPFGLTDQLSLDWPILLGHIILFACLLSMSVIDLKYYWVDVRFTNVVIIAGFILHALWTPNHSTEWIRPSDTTAVMSLFAVVGLGIVWIVLRWTARVSPAESEQSPAADGVAPGNCGQSPFGEQSPAGPMPTTSLSSPSRAVGWVAGAMLLGMVAALLLDQTGKIELRHAWRAMLPLLLFFSLIVWGSTVARPSDQQIVEAIHEERHRARRMVLREFALLLPAIIAAAVGLWIMADAGDLSNRISEALHAKTSVLGLLMFRGWSPLYGLATAATGYIIAGGVGWAVRIVFTLVFGKEAFGSGDIHLMAATGCVAGWPVVVLGFFLTCGLAMVGWLMALPFKRSRALPLGPWLSLSFLAVVVFYDSIIKWPVVARMIHLANLLFLEDSQIPVFEGL